MIKLGLWGFKMMNELKELKYKGYFILISADEVENIQWEVFNGHPSHAVSEAGEDGHNVIDMAIEDAKEYIDEKVKDDKRWRV